MLNMSTAQLTLDYMCLHWTVRQDIHKDMTGNTLESKSFEGDGTVYSLGFLRTPLIGLVDPLVIVGVVIVVGGGVSVAMGVYLGLVSALTVDSDIFLSRCFWMLAKL